MKIDAPSFHLGIAEFNRQEFYECHESLEEYWQTLSVDVAHKELIQGIIQIAVAFYHLRRNNVKGALKLLVRGNGRLAAYLPASAGLELSECSEAVTLDIALIEAGCAFDDARLKIPTIQNNWPS
jgi:predicted metal-dependent hydrolase